MNVLGLSGYYHDSAAAIVCDGKLVAAAEEERFNRVKHYSGFPERAVAYCLEQAGLKITDVDQIAFYEKPRLKLRRLLTTILATWPKSYQTWMQGIPIWLGRKLHIDREVRERLGWNKPLLYCQHHLSHAASAFLVSPFEEAAIISVDGVGEWTTTGWGVGRGLDINLSKEIHFPHSIGLLFSAITAYLGFRVNDAEWKVMGLAPYGRPKYLEQFRKMVDILPDGSFRLNMKYFTFPHSSDLPFDEKEWQQLFGRPRRPKETELEDFHSDVASSGQKIVEELMVGIAREAHRSTGMKNVCLAGGVALNCVANWRILQESGFERIFIQPAAGDSGGALGAAFYVYNTVLRQPRKHVMTHALLGPSFSNDQIFAMLKRNNAKFERIDDDAGLVDRTARLLADGKVVAWFQGRMEFGPRALGARSLLADPRDSGMKDTINAKVKFRESFRPFAPAVLKERAHEFFMMPEGMDAPFMLLVPKVRPEMHAVIPAVTHQDGTGRVQTVTRDTNPLYYDLIRKFGEITGVPVIINTSFNVRGEPIVCTPQDAYSTFLKTGIDALVIGNFIVTEKPAPVDYDAGMEQSVALEAGSVSEVVYPLF